MTLTSFYCVYIQKNKRFSHRNSTLVHPGSYRPLAQLLLGLGSRPTWSGLDCVGVTLLDNPWPTYCIWTWLCVICWPLPPPTGKLAEYKEKCLLLSKCRHWCEGESAAVRRRVCAFSSAAQADAVCALRGRTTPQLYRFGCIMGVMELWSLHQTVSWRRSISLSPYYIFPHVCLSPQSITL